ncbi:GNAT family N-acetyltransferase [Planctomycetota bacterium]
MSEQIEVRRGDVADAAELIRFNIEMAMETEGKVLHPAVVSSGVEQVIHRPELGMYVVAVKKGTLVAGLMITKEWSDWRNGEFWWIQSVYVDPEYRKQGVFRKLYEFIQDEAKEAKDVIGFRLYVEESNKQAQKTYKALGMKETSYKMFEKEFIKKD